MNFRLRPREHKNLNSYECIFKLKREAEEEGRDFWHLLMKHKNHALFAKCFLI